MTAAGNNNSDACATTPAGSPFTITVGAVDASQVRIRSQGGPGSNYGKCIDLYAPGQQVPGASAAGDYQAVPLSGTSQAVAFAAGAAAMHLQANPTASPQELRQALVSSAVAGAVNEQHPDGTADYTAPFLQVAELGGGERAKLAPPVMRLDVGLAGLGLVYSMKLSFSKPAEAAVNVSIVEREDPRQGPRINARRTFVLPNGSSGGSVDLTVNETIALSTTDAGSFFVDVVLQSTDMGLNGRQLPVQARAADDATAVCWHALLSVLWCLQIFISVVWRTSLPFPNPWLPPLHLQNHGIGR